MDEGINLLLMNRPVGTIERQRETVSQVFETFLRVIWRPWKPETVRVVAILELKVRSYAQSAYLRCLLYLASESIPRGTDLRADQRGGVGLNWTPCLLYTSDAADEMD